MTIDAVRTTSQAVLAATRLPLDAAGTLDRAVVHEVARALAALIVADM